MINKALVFVPHPDDEINIAGQMIWFLKNKDIDLKVIYLTNGDYENGTADRIQEAMASLKVLGVRRDSIIFLGYGDGWRGGKHIYNCGEREVIVSHAGRKETFGNSQMLDFAYLEREKHNLYCRENIKNDIKTILLREMADLLIGVDFDQHPDHRALSLLFEESLGEILRENKKYEPYVLKKFAYGGVYSGISDYYDYYPLKPTAPPIKSKRLSEKYILDNPYYEWEERIRIQTPSRCCTKRITNNVLYKAAKMHRSQDIKRRICSICNGDIVYWQRRTDSILKYASVHVSSGEVDYLHDFKLFDCSDIRIRNDGTGIFDAGYWRPDIDDEERIISILFDRLFEITRIVIYQDVFHNNGIGSLQVEIGEKRYDYSFSVPKPRIDLRFDEVISADRITIRIADCYGASIGIGEIEVFSSKEQTIDDLFPIDESDLYYPRKESIGVLVDKWLVKPLIIGEKDSKDFSDDLLQTIRKIEPTRLRQYLDDQYWSRILIYGYGHVGYELSRMMSNRIVACVDARGDLLSCDYMLYESIESIEPNTVDAVILTMKNCTGLFEKMMRLGWKSEQIVMVSTLAERVIRDTVSGDQ